MSLRSNRIKCFLVFLLLLGITGCGKTGDSAEQETAKENGIYYLNKEGTALMLEQDAALTEHPEWSTEEQLQYLVTRLSDVPVQIEWKAPLRLGFSLDSWSIEETELVLNLSESYYDLSSTDEILVRAALVKTLTQAEGIDCVSIRILSEPLKDASGNAVDTMTADCFLEDELGGVNRQE